ncbi:MAG: hypothetical protein Q9227_001689 [Pyrenula ochraceoflavens]
MTSSPTCDFLLAWNKNTGISGQHFSVEIEEGNLLLKDQSCNGTMIRKTLGAASSQSVKIATCVFSSEVLIEAGDQTLRLELPLRDKETDSEHQDELAIIESNKLSRLSQTRDPAENLREKMEHLKYRIDTPTPHCETLHGKCRDYNLSSGQSRDMGDDVRLAWLPTSSPDIRQFSSIERRKSKLSLEEVETLKALSHENVVRLIDTIITDDKVHIMIEKVESTLKDRWPVRCKPAGLQDALLWQMLGALGYLHQLPMIHRSVTPSTIRIRRERPFHLQLAGFCFAVRSKAASGNPGCRAYQAPEMRLQSYEAPSRDQIDPEYGPGVDIWSLGLSVIERTEGFIIGMENNESHISHHLQANQSSNSHVLKAMLFSDPAARIEADKALSLLENDRPWNRVENHNGRGGEEKRKRQSMGSSDTEAMLKRQVVGKY